MSLLIAAIYDTEENQRTKFTEECLGSLFDTINLTKHRVVLVDNASCKETKELLDYWSKLPRLARME